MGGPAHELYGLAHITEGPSPEFYRRCASLTHIERLLPRPPIIPA